MYVLWRTFEKYKDSFITNDEIIHAYESKVDEILNNNQKFSEKNNEEKLTLIDSKSDYTAIIKTISY